MKKASFLSVAMMAILPLSAWAQDVKEIIQKHNEAIGGAKKWAAVTSMRREGSISIMGMEMPVTITTLKGKGMRQDFTVMGTPHYMIVTPGAGWTFMPAQGHTAPQAMSAEELKAAADMQLDFQDPIMEADTKHWPIVLDGEEELNGSRCFKLKVTDKEGVVVNYYVAAKDWYIIRSVRLQVPAEDGTMIDIVTGYSDYKRLPAGIVVPFSEDNGDSGTTHFTKIETNTIRDETLFRP